MGLACPEIRKFTLADRAKTEIASLRWYSLCQKSLRNATGMTLADRAARRAAISVSLGGRRISAKGQTKITPEPTLGRAGRCRYWVRSLASPFEGKEGREQKC
jgi:hypothetical protein